MLGDNSDRDLHVPEKNKAPPVGSAFNDGGADGTRTRDLRRDRPAL